jgi:hypothetical protein
MFHNNGSAKQALLAQSGHSVDEGNLPRDVNHLYEVERRVFHAERPGFRILELQLSPTQGAAH